MNVYLVFTEKAHGECRLIYTLLQTMWALGWLSPNRCCYIFIPSKKKSKKKKICMHINRPYQGFSASKGHWAARYGLKCISRYDLRQRR